MPGFKGSESETSIGKWIKERKIRKGIFLASKIGFDYGSIKRELKSTAIFAECEKSLRRLGVETIDLYYAHIDDRGTEWLLHQERPILPVFSASSREQLAENPNALRVKFSDEQFSRLHNVVNT